MAKQLVAVIDGARARYYVVGTRTGLGGAERNKLEEVASLINPEHRAKDAEIYSESRPGVRQAPAGGPGHGVHDHRDAHADEVERRFAAMVLKELAEQIREHDANNVILAAAPRMLGFLRDTRTPLPRIPIGELPKHLTELSPHDLCERLEADGLLSA